MEWIDINKKTPELDKNILVTDGDDIRIGYFYKVSANYIGLIIQEYTGLYVSVYQDFDEKDVKYWSKLLKLPKD